MSWKAWIGLGVSARVYNQKPRRSREGIFLSRSWDLVLPGCSAPHLNGNVALSPSFPGLSTLDSETPVSTFSFSSGPSVWSYSLWLSSSLPHTSCTKISDHLVLLSCKRNKGVLILELLIICAQFHTTQRCVLLKVGYINFIVNVLSSITKLCTNWSFFTLIYR